MLAGSIGPAGILDIVATNAMAAHTDDLDDLHWDSLTHPGSIIWPAVLAVGQAHVIPLASIVDSAVLGYQVMARSSLLLGSGHRRYFHASASCGGVAVAAAVASLLDASDDEIVTGMSHAASGMGGSAQAVREHSRTTMLHRGFAATVGTIAAYSHGLTPAVREPLEGNHGLVAATNIAPEVNSLEVPLELAIQQVTFRRHPVTGFAHTLVDALLDLGPVDVSQIDAVEASIPSWELDLTVTTVPETRDEAAWSLRHAAAAALVGDLPSRRLRWPTDPETERLSHRVLVEPRQAAPPDLAVTGQVTLSGGRQRKFVRDVPYGHPDQPFSDEELVMKAERLGVMKAAGGLAVLTGLRENRGILDKDLLSPFGTATARF